MYGNSLHIELSIYCGVIHFIECCVILSSLRVLLVEFEVDLYLKLKLTLFANKLYSSFSSKQRDFDYLF